MARILIIDDEECIRRPLQAVLERFGHEVMSAANGQEGLQVWRRFGADLVITDVMMPYKNGIETIMEMRASFPPVPVIAMSGGDVSQRLDLLGNASLLGAVHTIQKPFALAEILDKVAQVLGVQADTGPAPVRDAHPPARRSRSSA